MLNKREKYSIRIKEDYFNRSMKVFFKSLFNQNVIIDKKYHYESVEISKIVNNPNQLLILGSYLESIYSIIETDQKIKLEFYELIFDFMDNNKTTSIENEFSLNAIGLVSHSDNFKQLIYEINTKDVSASEKKILIDIAYEKLLELDYFIQGFEPMELDFSKYPIILPVVEKNIEEKIYKGISSQMKDFLIKK